MTSTLTERSISTNVLAGGLLVLILLGGVVALRNSLSGCRLRKILSGSMAPTIPNGAAVLLCKSPHAFYGVGEIIAFSDPASLKGKEVIHRVSSVYANHSGAAVIRTKGDANVGEDPWEISQGAVHGVVRYSLPYVGYILRNIATPMSFIVLSVASFLLVVWREICMLYAGGRAVLVRIYRHKITA